MSLVSSTPLCMNAFCHAGATLAAGGSAAQKRANHKFQKKLARTKGDRGQVRCDGV